MASLDHLPADQRAVLELVLQRGRNYDQIATLLSVDRAGVRQRALSAFDALAPDSDIAPEQRGLIADYLLGQLPPRVAETVHDRLASSPAERAWARILASELAPIASAPLPEIPVSAAAAPSTPPAAAAEPAPAAAAEPTTPAPTSDQAVPPRPRDGRRSSRLGGAVVLGLGAAVVLGVIAVLIFVVFGSSGTKHSNSHPSAARTTSSTTTATAKPIAQVNLFPAASGSKATGIAQVVQVGPTRGIVLVAQNIPPNKNNFYAVWLYNSPSQYEIVGYVNPGVGSNGQMQTTGPLPTDASKYGQLIVAIQTKAKPKPPGPIVLQGKLTLK